jgi:hypothetical protein
LVKILRNTLENNVLYDTELKTTFSLKSIVIHADGVGDLDMRKLFPSDKMELMPVALSDGSSAEAAREPDR